MRKKQMTMKELHEHMAKPRCENCGRVKEAHIHTVSGKIYCASGSAIIEARFEERR